MPLVYWIALAAIAFCGISALIGVALGTAMDRLGRTPKPPFRPAVVPDPDDDGDVCDVHDCDLVWAEYGSAESGPGEPYLTCPKCDEENEPHCPDCGLSIADGYVAKAVPTRNYGGGWDSYYRCPSCGYTDVAV